MQRRMTTPYFPAAMKFTTPLIFVAAIYLVITGTFVWSAILLVLGLLVLTTNYVTIIDMKDKSYKDYLSVLGLRLNEDKNKFKFVDRIVISKGNYSQTINTRVQSRQLDWSDYTATVLFDNDSLDLLTKNDKKELLKNIKDYSEFLKIGVEDRTTPQFFWIDMSKIQH